MHDTNVIKLYSSCIQQQKQQTMLFQREVERQVRFIAVAGDTEYPPMNDLINCGFSNLEKVVLQKQDGNLTQIQEGFLDGNSWVRSTYTPRDVWRYTNIGPEPNPELEFLDQKSLENKAVRNSEELQETKANCNRLS